MSKQTAVQWLLEQWSILESQIPSRIIDQAKAMEKEQIKNAWNRGQYIGTYFYGKQIEKPHEQNAEQYYNQIYIE
jgi:alpha-glucuronidase